MGPTVKKRVKAPKSEATAQEWVRPGNLNNGVEGPRMGSRPNRLKHPKEMVMERPHSTAVGLSPDPRIPYRYFMIAHTQVLYLDLGSAMTFGFQPI